MSDASYRLLDKEIRAYAAGLDMLERDLLNIVGHVKVLHDNAEQDAAELPEPDPNNPAHLRFAADIVSGVYQTATSGRHLRDEADRLEAEQSQVSRREQAIEKLARRQYELTRNPKPVDRWDKITEAARESWRPDIRALVDAYPGIVDAVLGGE